jgi:hypothetical protein
LNYAENVTVFAGPYRRMAEIKKAVYAKNKHTGMQIGLSQGSCHSLRTGIAKVTKHIAEV